MFQRIWWGKVQFLIRHLTQITQNEIRIDETISRGYKKDFDLQDKHHPLSMTKTIGHGIWIHWCIAVAPQNLVSYKKSILDCQKGLLFLFLWSFEIILKQNETLPGSRVVWSERANEVKCTKSALLLEKTIIMQTIYYTTIIHKKWIKPSNKFIERCRCKSRERDGLY